MDNRDPYEIRMNGIEGRCACSCKEISRYVVVAGRKFIDSK